MGKCRTIEEIEDISQNYKNQNAQSIHKDDIGIRYCQRPGCENPIPESQRRGRRRKYCSYECSKIINYQRARAVSRNQKVSKICLKCNEPFMSEGPWNRICPRCSEKNKNIYQKAELGGAIDLS